MALQQPDMEVLNGSALSFTNELAKFSNIPAIVQGNAILNAIADLGDRLDGRLDNCFEQLTTRIRAADRNQIARLVNSACTQPISPLTPLINSVNGNPIHQFPATVAVIDAMASPDVNRVLNELDQSITGTLQSRRARLIRAVGVLVQIAGGN